MTDLCSAHIGIIYLYIEESGLIQIIYLSGLLVQYPDGIWKWCLFCLL